MLLNFEWLVQSCLTEAITREQNFCGATTDVVLQVRKTRGISIFNGMSGVSLVARAPPGAALTTIPSASNLSAASGRVSHGVSHGVGASDRSSAAHGQSVSA